MNETKPKRRWFRFSIRDLLWLTALIAIALRWGVNEFHHQQLIRENASYKQQVDQLTDRLQANVERWTQLQLMLDRQPALAEAPDSQSK
jgi:C4-dicarboxylate-specific signal transduction histidine kinase